MDSQELTLWSEYFRLRNQEDELRQRGYSADEIADIVEGARDYYDGASEIVNAALNDDERAARIAAFEQRQQLFQELDDDE